MTESPLWEMFTVDTLGWWGGAGVRGVGIVSVVKDGFLEEVISILSSEV